ncbi:COG1361 S-layer family protein [Anaerococcus prevotii]|uniref:Conserved domain protein n=1 Tax=Anaerococcus prevotii ACS-065-V-Col13 TaxID=879305 RepID=F0GVG9_9FIRM|nr:CARDB domain-containing protein [Anaerococcus prevotii]EGC82193.1 conserved domain protein [Anaerococcus prevotii ACS-065-V-Col13]
MMGEENTQYETVSNNEIAEENNSENTQSAIRNQPKLIISDYDLSPSMVEAGKDFNLSFTLYNTNSENAIYNLKVTIDQTLAAAPQTSGQNNANLTSDGSVFTPIGRSNTFYVASLYPWEWTTKYIDMNVLPNANPGSYVVNLTMEYEDYWGNQYKTQESIGIPVTQEASVNFGKVKLDDISMGVPNSVSVNLYNTGKDNLNTVMCRVKGDGFSVDEDERFIGNFNAGSQETFSFNLTPEKEGKIKGKIEITYKDSTGKEHTDVKDFEKEVSQSFDQEGMIDPETGEMIGEAPVDSSPSLVTSPFLWIGLLVLVALIIALIRKKENPKKTRSLS